MRRRPSVAAFMLAGAAIVLGWLLFVELPQRYGRRPPAAAPERSPKPPAVRRIKATVFYVSGDGLRLTGIEREIPFGEGTVAQARLLIDEQLADAAPPLVSAIPRGTRLRALYVTERGEAFVDMSREVTVAHPGGSLNEIFTVYTIVNALTVNLPAIATVQILIEGREVDTLAGHLDLRQPLQKDLRWVGGG